MPQQPQEPRQRMPNDDRSDTLNKNNPRHQDALDEHSRRRNSEAPRNAGTPKPSSPPGKGHK